MPAEKLTLQIQLLQLWQELPREEGSKTLLHVLFDMIHVLEDEDPQPLQGDLGAGPLHFIILDSTWPQAYTLRKWFPCLPRHS